MASDGKHGMEVPGLVPSPREVQLLDGGSGLSAPLTVGLSGLSVERLAIAAEVLTRAGVRVAESSNGPGTVAVRFEEGPGLREAGPTAAESYELEIGHGRCTIRGPWPGLLWGTHTLAALATAAREGKTLPALRLRDWPDLGSRGVFVENKWGPDRMTLEDWQGLVERLAALKLNRLGVGLYGCWGSCRFEPGPRGMGWPTEFLMVPVPGHPELVSRKRLRWYSPADDQWHDETYLPRICSEDFLGEVVRYAAARGVTVVPFVNSFGHNTLIPRQLPELSAKNPDGTPRHIGYCLSSPLTRSFIEGFYGSVVERYFPGGAPFFHVQMDEVWPDHPDPDRPELKADPWCQCPDCRASKPELLLQDYVVWLVEMLTRKGVGTVVMWNDQLTRHMDALDEGLVARLRDKGLDRRLVLHWWWYDNDALNDRTRVAIGRQLGLAGWVAPMTCYYNWMTYNPRLKNIDLMLRMAREEGGEGAVSYAVHDPGWIDHEMLLASHAWNGGAVAGWETEVPRWAQIRFGGDAPEYLRATALLREAAAVPVLGRCHHYTYTYFRESCPFPRPYPGEALAGLDQTPEAEVQLVRAAVLARDAVAGLTAVARGRRGEDRATPASLMGEAARLQGLAAAFASLLPLWRDAARGSVDPTRITALSEGRRSLIEAMRVVEREKPSWVVPACLQSLAVLVEFIDQLTEELAEVARGTRAVEDLHWTVVGGGVP